jgi:CRISPR type I-E-associated protein CasB/Cse2
MNRNYQFPDRVRHFLQRLRDRCGSKRDDRPPDPGARAALRRGASETTRHLAWPVILQCGGDIRHPAWTAVAAAFAFYPQPEAKPDPRFNFGTTCFALAEPTRDNGKSSFDSRFRRVLGADSAEDLAKWIVQIAKRAKTAKPRPAPLNYEELLTSLLHWDARDGALREGVRRRWATAYWQPETLADDESVEL